MGKNKVLNLQCLVPLLLLFTRTFVVSHPGQPEIIQHDDGNTTSVEILALFDFVMGQIYYKDEQLKVCFAENYDPAEQLGLLIMPQNVPFVETEDLRNMSSLSRLFCGDFPVYSLSKLINHNPSVDENETVHRSKRSVGGWYPGGQGQGGASQSQIQGQVSGQGFFSGQAQSQISGASQTQVQLSGTGILGSVSSSAGNAQAQIALGESTGAGQAGSSGFGPSKSQVQVNLGQNGRGSMASAGVIADEGFDNSGRQYGYPRFTQSSVGGPVSGFDHASPQYSGSGPVNRGVYQFGGNQNNGYQGHRRGDSKSTTGLDTGSFQPQHTTSYGTVDQGAGVGQQSPKYPGFQTPRFNGADNNLYQTSPPLSHPNANLPQLPDIMDGSNLFPSSGSNAGQGGINFEDLKNQGLASQGLSGLINRNPELPYHSDGGVYSRGPIEDIVVGDNGYRQPLPSIGQHIQNGSPYNVGSVYRGGGGSGLGGIGYGGGNTAYAGGSGLPHALASSYGSGQAQAQSQMVHLGRGTTEFYHPQTGGSGLPSSSSYPQAHIQGNGRKDYVSHYNAETTLGEGQTPRPNGVRVGVPSRSSNGLSGGQQPASTATGLSQSPKQTYPGTLFPAQIQNTSTRETIRDGYIPYGNGYVRPYLNGPLSQNGNGGANGQYPTHSGPSSLPTLSVTPIPITQAPISHSNGIQAQQHSDYLTSSASPATTATAQRQLSKTNRISPSQSNGFLPSQTNGFSPSQTNGFSPSQTNGHSSFPIQQTYQPNNLGRGTYSANGNYPTSGQTYFQQASGHDTDSKGSYPVFTKPQSYSNGNGNGNNKKCSVVTFTCTVLIESNGRAKICRPNGKQAQSSTATGDYGSGHIDQSNFKPMQICCC